jgi:hypothetical protein
VFAAAASRDWNRSGIAPPDVTYVSFIGHGTPEQSRRKEIKMQLTTPLRVSPLKGDIWENIIEDDDRSGVAACVPTVDNAACRCL